MQIQYISQIFNFEILNYFYYSDVIFIYLQVDIAETS